MAAGIGTGVGAGGWWLATSKRRAARWARRLWEDARRPVTPAPVRPTPDQWSDNKITVCWLGHSTVLLNFYGIRVLTDPVLDNRVGLSLGLGMAGPKRYIAPALKAKELPPIDLVLLSHAHRDHMDLPTLSRLPANVSVVTAKKTQDVFSGTRLKYPNELAWGQTTTFRNGKGELQLEALEVKHWGARWPSNLERGYNGYVLRREGKAVLFGGDTALTPAFAGHRSRGPFVAAIMPIGSYNPWIWNHCTPEQAVDMANAARADYILPVHHQTFCLSDEPMLEPIERLEAALQHESERIGWRRIGETIVLS
jgi:L-ascorbate metabolism protein UlaG (beta-lactamase superfamily)